MSNDYDPNFKKIDYYFLVGVKVVVENENGEVLILKRSEKVGGGGLWSFPGGAVEHGEDVYDATRREVNEETGLEIEKLKPFSIKTHIKGNKDSAIIIGLRVKLISGDVELNWEHDEFKWIVPDEVSDLKLTSDADYFLRNIYNK